MNYQKIYDDICKRGQERELPKEIYTEKHHIVPRCLGGGNEKENITKLTAKEHYLVHLILCRKLYPNNPKLWYAMHRMLSRSNLLIGRYIPSGKMYQDLRNEVNLKMKDRKLSKETRQLMSLRQKGKIVNAKPIIHVASGMTFSNIKIASKYFKVQQETITKRIKNNIFKLLTKEEFEILSIQNKNLIAETPTKRIRTHPVTDEFKQKCRDNSSSTKICEIDGIVYKSVRIASEHLSIPYYTVHHRIQSTSKKWSSWLYP